MAEALLKGQVRAGLGKEAVKKLRHQRLIPAVVYGGAAGPVPVTINPIELAKILGTRAGENVLITLSLAGDGERTTTVILKELQRDPVRGEPLHADFMEISMKRKIRVQIPVQLVGEAIGVKNKGGFLEQHLRDVAVECLPGAIPEQVKVEVTNLDVGDSIHVRDLTVAEGVRLIDDPARAVVSVLIPRAVAEEAPVAAEEKPAEPEVVGKKEAKAAEPEVVAKKEAKEVKEAKKEAGKAEG
jgi:large subunit ribosomal protein L25